MEEDVLAVDWQGQSGNLWKLPSDPLLQRQSWPVGPGVGIEYHADTLLSL